ncbi:GNAT family N-acetyltransferase [Sporosarcina sp. NPDC096371]|uniref:GNAT family N-acetyltransferase n=1 Tax=Sporosarcina sp. NPDC096371 TaxID=3364530 RepID=UPI003820AAD6
MDIFLEKLHLADAEQLFAFELDNRTYFEEMVPTRGNDYYNFDFFKSRHESLLEEQDQGSSCFYLIKDKDASILGRMNVVDIEEPQGVGHLGYRVGQIHTGKGIAHKALKILIEKVVEEGRIKQLRAQTTTNNIASQKVLEKNGFEMIGTSDETFEMNNQQLTFVYYSWSSLLK